MIFKITSKLHWESINTHGVVVNIFITEEGKSRLASSVETKDFDHPIDAMNYSASLKETNVTQEKKAHEAENCTPANP